MYREGYCLGKLKWFANVWLFEPGTRPSPLRGYNMPSLESKYYLCTSLTDFSMAHPDKVRWTCSLTKTKYPIAFSAIQALAAWSKNKRCVHPPPPPPPPPIYFSIVRIYTMHSVIYWKPAINTSRWILSQKRT